MTDCKKTKDANIHRLSVRPDGGLYRAYFDGEPLTVTGFAPWAAFHAAECLVVGLVKKRLK